MQKSGGLWKSKEYLNFVEGTKRKVGFRNYHVDQRKF